MKGYGGTAFPERSPGAMDKRRVAAIRRCDWENAPARADCACDVCRGENAETRIFHWDHWSANRKLPEQALDHMMVCRSCANILSHEWMACDCTIVEKGK